MNDCLVHRRPRRAEIGKLGVYPLAPQDVDRRHRLPAFLVGDRAFDNCPMNSAGVAVAGLFGNILETPIDYRLKGVELLLGLLLRCVPTSSLVSVPRTGAAWTARPISPIPAVRCSSARLT
jgi:hypothetical protein